MFSRQVVTSAQENNEQTMKALCVPIAMCGLNSSNLLTKDIQELRLRTQHMEVQRFGQARGAVHQHVTSSIESMVQVSRQLEESLGFTFVCRSPGPCMLRECRIRLTVQHSAASSKIEEIEQSHNHGQKAFASKLDSHAQSLLLLAATISGALQVVGGGVSCETQAQAGTAGNQAPGGAKCPARLHREP